MTASRDDLLTAQPFLAGLPEEHVRLLAPLASRCVLPAGTRVFSEGGHADRFFLLDSGRVQLDTHVPGQGDVVVETLTRGAVLGWSWLFPPYRWHFGAVAVETTHAVSLDGDGVRRLCARNPELGFELTSRFVQVVVDRLQATRLRLLDLYKVPP